ncbi:MAG: hypothetical protein M1821_007306 [Bathelium mastoideum]|nr:MAG: hypothetical protein M1821_007306 [Bathelium mastoideum]
MDHVSTALTDVNIDYAWTALMSVIAFVIYSAIWRLYLSPIAQFPGPRFAALTDLYEMYYSNWLGGKYVFKIAEMHKQYGPIVRISPSELHIGDPAKFLGLKNSMAATVDHDTHRIRRVALLPSFSTSYVRKLQPVIQERLNVLLQRIVDFKDTNQTVNANCMYAALSNDLVQLFTFGEHSYKLETPDFDSTERDASLNGVMSFHVTKRLPWLNDIMMALPQSLIKHVNHALSSFVQQKHTTRQKVEKLAAMPVDEWAGKDTQPVARSLLDSAKLPSDERTVDRVAQDAQMLLMAGTLTMASALERLTFWMIDNPGVLQKLKEELRDVMPSISDVSKTPLATLENLPYLTAVIKEAIRLNYGISTPNFRSNPETPLVFEDKNKGKSWLIPPKTPIGMSSVILHHDEHHFPDSSKFDPERWMGEEGKKLDRYNVGFGKGGRICLGMNQTYGILRLATAQIWRLWASADVSIGDEIGVLGLYNTTSHDVKMRGDFFLPAYNKPQGVEFRVYSR